MREKTLVNKSAHTHARGRHAYPCRQYTRVPTRAIGAPAAHAHCAIAPAHAINVSMHAIDTSMHTPIHAIDAHACNRHVLHTCPTPLSRSHTLSIRPIHAI